MTQKELKLIDSILAVLDKGECRMFDSRTFQDTGYRGYLFTRRQFDFIEPFLEKAVIETIGNFRFKQKMASGVTFGANDEAVVKNLKADTLSSILQVMKLRKNTKYSDFID